MNGINLKLELGILNQLRSFKNLLVFMSCVNYIIERKMSGKNTNHWKGRTNTYE